MKKTLITLTSLMLTMTGICQTYYPFPTNTAVWTVSHCSYLSQWIWDSQNFKTAMIGDTTINGKNFQKIYFSKDTPFDIDSSSYVMALREEN